ncbi:hypothetical protein [Clostridium butyricum]|uniref:hypothetical protein n=1 Tax=Clostridium butyricum TaxID=1492 RepID=UPI002AAF3D79|nr:hypothetical protein [Clostridium butyricum]
MEKANNYEISELIEKAIERYENKRKRKFRERIFRNTKLLMENYNDFKNHINYSIADINDLQSIVDLDLKENECDELFILSIKQSKVKTLIITSHIEKAMELLEEEQKREGTVEKYQALEMYYLEKKSYEKIAEELNTGINTPKRWIKQMLERLGILLFGIDGLKLEW